MRLSALLLLLIPLFNTGCTVFMWEDAVRTHDDGGYLQGTTGEGVDRRIVASYRGSWNNRLFALPADSDGRLTGPLVYNGFERTAAGITKDLTDPQRESLRAYRFEPANAVDYKDFEWWPWDPARSGQSSLDIPELHCTAFALDQNDRPLPLVQPTAGSSCKEPMLVDDARIVLVPMRQPRSPAERNGAIARATLMTPLTVATDVVLSPLWLVFLVACNC